MTLTPEPPELHLAFIPPRGRDEDVRHWWQRRRRCAATWIIASPSWEEPIAMDNYRCVLRRGHDGPHTAPSLNR